MAKNNNSEKSAPAAPRVNSGSQGQEPRPQRYVVVREGHRVSANEYETPSDPKALEEARFWRGIANKHSWGERVEVVKYDNKFHRVW